MLDKYKQARAVNLAFLRDIRNLARRLDQARTTVVLSDQFQDGNFEDNPKWRVTSGKYWIEKNWGGLRSAVNKQDKAQQPSFLAKT